jgi:nicotinic acid phosphoribosyltransferase
MSALNDYLKLHDLEIRVDVHDALDAIKPIGTKKNIRINGSVMREVIYRRFWLNQTLDSIANDFGKSRERVRQIEARALRLLRQQFHHNQFAKRKGNVNA